MKKFLIVAVPVLFLSACTQEPEPEAAAVDIAAGQAIADRECSGCHAVDGSGMTAEIPNLAAQPASYLIDAMHAYRDGRRHHAALADLMSQMNESEIRNIAGWYASLPPVQSQAVSAQAPSSYEEGEEVATICTECHGDRGVSTTPGVPSLAGQQPVYLIVSTQEYARGERGHVEKEEMLKGLQQIDIEKMAMYFAAQLPPARPAPPFGDPAAGEPLTAICGGCHGARGVSHDPMVPTLAGQEPNYLVSAIKAYRDRTREHEDMVTDKSDQDVENIAAYYTVQSIAGSTESEESLEQLALKCDRCHGPGAARSSLVVPSLNGQKREYLIRVMKEYRDNDRGNSMMHKMSSGYSDETIEAIASYYAGRPAQNP